MRAASGFWRWTPLILILCLVSGCIPGKKRYLYDEIRKGYADGFTSVAPVQSDPERETTDRIDRPVTLADAIEIALKNSPDKKIAAARIRKAGADVQEANAAFYPHLGFYTEYTAADAPSAYLFKTIDQRRLPGDADFNEPGRLDNFETGFQARLNLYNGGRDYLGRQIADAGVNISLLDQAAVDNALIAAVISRFYTALAARALIGIAEESVTTVQKQLEIMQTRFEGGGVLRSDLLSLEVRLAESREELVRSHSRYQNALVNLADIMGVAFEPSVRLEAAGMDTPTIPSDYSSGLAYSFTHRPELERARVSVVRSRMALDAAQSTYMPTLDLTGRYYFDDEKMAYDMDRKNWVVAVMLNWDLFTGFSTGAAMKRADAMVAEAFAEDHRTLLAVRREVKSAYLNLDEARARRLVAQRSKILAEASLELVRTQYEGGAANITRYLEAELDRNRAGVRAAAAFYDQETARAEVCRAVGCWVNGQERPQPSDANPLQAR
ncbi:MULTISPECIES: TolC family protein [Desulfococcus]|jgi:outer membrane protein TolC|uniref:Outer membrane efflux protein n=1 Tax=Desulfococcus multivorans DSM 2059 TaxID=1121405 RepID=S7TS92_DESML|nr:TolC family protein [Desulfococcus multivorans]EPR40027.1 outer membrane efflux protein [Desulfococcus multivorans DSM 2059]MDX9817354.1 TolC family protein [Desulfococcus multivorans]SKA01160.1 Outer membrane protein TolC [Desulfococcus multivorans DSM 2059]